MKLAKVMGCVVVMVMGCSSVAYASNGSYFPPERIHCAKTDTGRIRCEGFNHQYLTEDVHTADLSKREDNFNFSSGVAYFTPDMSEASVFYTYKNADQRIVKLKTTSILIKPDLSNSAWTKVQDDLYVCDAGYMHCPITDTSVN